MLVSYHVRVSEWIYTLSCLNVKGLLARNSRDIWSFSDSNGTRTYNQLVCKRTLRDLATLAKLNFRYRTCFEQRVTWYSCNRWVKIHSKTRTWHDNCIESNAPYRYVLTTQLNHLASLNKWLRVRLRTKWLRVWVRCCDLRILQLDMFYVISK